MPIVAAQLEPGDILFKHASAGFVSQRIRKGQASHYDDFVSSTGLVGPMGRDQTTDISHVATPSPMSTPTTGAFLLT